MKRTLPTTLPLALVFLPVSLSAQDRGLEKYHFELTAGAWLVGVTGRAGSAATSADFDSDLQMGGQEPRFFGKLALKLGRHRFFVEGFPYHREARFIPLRDFSLGGRMVFASGRSIDAWADADYFLAGYQYDAVSRARGHLGLLVGAGRVQGEAEARLTNPTNFFEERSAFTRGAAPIGAVGAEGRVYLTSWLSAAGEVNGLGLGSRGHFVSGSTHLGIGLGCCAMAQAGYALIDVRARTGGVDGGIEPRLSGPVFSIVLLDRRR